MYHEWTDEFGDRYAVGSGYIFHKKGSNPIVNGYLKSKSLDFLRFTVCVGQHKEENGEITRKYCNVTVYANYINSTIFALAKTFRNLQRVFFWGPVYVFKNADGLMCRDVSAEGFFLSDSLAELQLGEKVKPIKNKNLNAAKSDAEYDPIYPF